MATMRIRGISPAITAAILLVVTVSLAAVAYYYIRGAAKPAPSYRIAITGGYIVKVYADPGIGQSILRVIAYVTVSGTGSSKITNVTLSIPWNKTIRCELLTPVNTTRLLPGTVYKIPLMFRCNYIPEDYSYMLLTVTVKTTGGREEYAMVLVPVLPPTNVV